MADGVGGGRVVGPDRDDAVGMLWLQVAEILLGALRKSVLGYEDCFVAVGCVDDGCVELEVWGYH